MQTTASQLQTPPQSDPLASATPCDNEEASKSREVRIAIHAPACSIADCTLAAHTRCRGCQALICLVHTVAKEDLYMRCRSCQTKVDLEDEERKARARAALRSFLGYITLAALVMTIIFYSVK